MGYGNGVYKSTDAGKTWTHLGLDETQHIGKIAVDPKNANVLFVAAIGHLYAPNPERGVFRSTDGGKSWKKVLFKNDNVGAVDVAIDPTELARRLRQPLEYAAAAVVRISRRTDPAAASSSPPTAAPRGSSSPTACRRKASAALASR